MGTSGSENDGFPSELQDRLTSFDDALTDIENIFSASQSTPLNEIHSKVSTLDKAKLDLLGAYTMNSLFWMYLSVTGENPKEHDVKQELDRIRGYMGRVKEIEDKAKAPKLDKDASKRFIRSALWQQAHQQTEDPQKSEAPKRKLDEPSTSAETTTNDQPSTSTQNNSTKAETDSYTKRKKSKKKNSK